MKLNGLKGAHNLSGCDLVPVRVEQPGGGAENCYRIEKSHFFQRTVRFIRYYVSGSYRQNVKEMRRDVLRDLEEYAPIADTRTHGTADSKNVKDEIDARLEKLRDPGINSRKFVKEVRSLARFAEKEGTVVSASKRTGWTGKSSSLSAGELQKFIQADGWEMKFVKQRPDKNRPPSALEVKPRPNLMPGLAALECMTPVLLSDGVLQHPVGNNPEIGPEGGALGTQSVGEKQERVTTAMAVLKFLTTEPHDKTNEALFKWSGPQDVGDADKARFAVTAFHGIAKPKNFPEGSTPYLKILTPEKALQQHVVNLLDKFPYAEGKGIVIDKRECQTMLQEAGREAGGEEKLTSKQQEWVADKLLEFLS